MTTMAHEHVHSSGNYSTAQRKLIRPVPRNDTKQYTCIVATPYQFLLDNTIQSVPMDSRTNRAPKSTPQDEKHDMCAGADPWVGNTGHIPHPPPPTSQAQQLPSCTSDLPFVQKCIKYQMI